MKVLSSLVVGLLVLGATSVRAQDRCGLFSADSKCQRSVAPNIHVDFAKGLQFEKPARPMPSQTPARPGASASEKQGIDCQMIRNADRNLDPRIVKAPPSGVKYALRVIEAPACPAK